MNQLHQIQSLFMDAIFNGPDDNPAINQLGHYITEKNNLTQEQQINIYRESVIGCMVTALTQIYPVCHKLVGDRFFDFMSTQFIYHNKSVSPDLADYGKHFDRFISSFKPAADLVYLPDVATLEWTWHKAFNAADHNGLDIQKLSMLTKDQQETLRFSLPPNSYLIESDFPIHKIWHANQNNSETDETINLDEGVIKLLVWRQHLSMRIDTLEDDEWLFLSAIKNNQSFIKICQTFEQYPDINIETLLPQCIKKGWVADFTTSPE